MSAGFGFGHFDKTSEHISVYMFMQQSATSVLIWKFWPRDASKPNILSAFVSFLILSKGLLTCQFQPGPTD